MNTDELIALLVQQPANTKSLQQRLLYGVLAGSGAALLLVVLMGLRPDLRQAFFTASFWMKWTYTLAVALGAWVCFERVARPGRTPDWYLVAAVLPLVILAIIGLPPLLSLPADMRRTLWLGHSALMCPWLIGLVSLPVFVALSQAIRTAAPTRLRWAGFTTGLLAGGIAAFFYCLFCTESSIAFVASWYSLGMLLPAAAGALFGPALLRWR